MTRLTPPLKKNQTFWKCKDLVSGFVYLIAAMPRNVPNECLNGQQIAVVEIQGSVTMVDGDTWNQVPVPCSEYNFILVFTKIGVGNTIREMEPERLHISKWLSRMDIRYDNILRLEPLTVET